MSVVRINVDLQDEDSVSELNTYLWSKFYGVSLNQVVLGTVSDDGIRFATLPNKFSDVNEDGVVNYIESIIELIKNSELPAVYLQHPEDFIRIYVDGRELVNDNARDAIGYYSDFLHDYPEAIQLLDNLNEFDEAFDAWLKRHRLFIHKSMLAK
jgi:hypothetical protein